MNGPIDSLVGLGIIVVLAASVIAASPPSKPTEQKAPLKPGQVATEGTAPTTEKAPEPAPKSEPSSTEKKIDRIESALEQVKKRLDSIEKKLEPKE